jgi:hypothetical protein
MRRGAGMCVAARTLHDRFATRVPAVIKPHIPATGSFRPGAAHPKKEAA